MPSLTLLIVVLLSGAENPMLVVEVSADVLLEADRVVEELRLRMPDVGVASTAQEPAYRLRITPGCETDAVSGATNPLICASVELTDALGTRLMDESIVSYEGTQQIARELAVLVEARLRLHAQRLEALLEVIHQRRPVPIVVPETTPEPLSAPTMLYADLSFAAALYPTSKRAAIGVEAGVDVMLLRWMSARLEVGTTWPRSTTVEQLEITSRETTGAVLVVARFWDHDPIITAGAGPVMYLISADAGSSSSGENNLTTVHAGGRLRLSIGYPLTDWFGVVGRLGADMVPRYPNHTWRGELINDRGAWRISAQIGMQARL